MDVELDIKNKLKEIYKYEKYTMENTKFSFIEQLENAFTKTDIFDNKETTENIDVFIEKIINKSLEIKKTLEPNHSKLYLFYEKEEINH
jgi:hypothetical protein